MPKKQAQSIEARTADKALAILHKSLDSTNDADALAAARSILDFATGTSEFWMIQERLDALEKRVRRCELKK